MNTNNIITIPVDESTVEFLAKTGLYLVELNDGQIVDLYDYYTNFGIGSIFDNFADTVKKFISKPLSVSGEFIADIFKAPALNQTGIAQAIESKNFGDLVKTVRVNLQNAGIIPTNETVNAAVQQLINGTYAQQAQGGGQVITLPVPQQQQYYQFDLEKYLPYIAIGAILLVVLLKK